MIYSIESSASFVSESRDPIDRVRPPAPFMGEGSRIQVPVKLFNSMIAPGLSSQYRARVPAGYLTSAPSLVMQKVDPGGRRKE